MSPGEAIAAVEAAATCSTGWSGILSCPREWQTLFAGALAVFAGLAIYFAARHQTRSAYLAEQRKTLASQKAAGIALAVEVKEIENSATASMETVNEIINGGGTIDTHVAAVFSQTGPELSHELRMQMASLRSAELAQAAMNVFGNAKKLRDGRAAQLKRFGPGMEFDPDHLKQLHDNFADLAKLAAQTRKALFHFATTLDR